MKNLLAQVNEARLAPWMKKLMEHTRILDFPYGTLYARIQRRARHATATTDYLHV